MTIWLSTIWRRYVVQGKQRRTLAALGKTDDFATVFTEMQVSENDMRLIGFATREERDWFRLLTGVQGVGGKVGLAILSAIEPADLALAISTRRCRNGRTRQWRRPEIGEPDCE